MMNIVDYYPSIIIYSIILIGIGCLIYYQLRIHHRCGKKELYIISLVVWLFAILGVTIVFRVPVGRHVLIGPLWSYKQIANGNYIQLVDNVINVGLFIPYGFLAPMTGFLKYYKEVVLLGVLLSVLIEITQFLLQVGYSDIDDILHNIIGMTLGYIIFKYLNCSNDIDKK